MMSVSKCPDCDVKEGERHYDGCIWEIKQARRERDEARGAMSLLGWERDQAVKQCEEARAALQGEQDQRLFDFVGYRQHLEILVHQRDEAQAAARDYLPRVKFSFDDLNAGKQHEIAERERLPWLGEPETPLEMQER
jgi:hypothetical protein